MANQLTIQEFIAQRKDPIDQLYVDKFWSSISDEKWIYIGVEMLRWIGYARAEIKKAKSQYWDLLTIHFELTTDYKHLTASEMKQFLVLTNQDLEMPTNFNQHNRTMHIIVSPDCFKESLMLMNTDRAKQIRKYYIQLEKVFKAYMQYCNDFKDAQIASVSEELKEAKASSDHFKMMILKKSEYKMDQYVYVASSRNYAKKNIFKVGMTKKLERRMTGYQTGRCSDDKFVYLYIMKCVDARAVEHALLSRLDSFRYEDSKELVQIHFKTLTSILSIYAEFEQSSTNTLNEMLTTYYDTYQDMPIARFEDIIIEDLDLYIEDKFNIKPIDRYVPAKDEAPHHKPLTDDQINAKLLPYGIQLKKPYGGCCDQVDTFQCMSVLNHTIRSSYSVLLRTIDQGCVYCRKIKILDQIPLYVYDETSYSLLQTYDSYDDLVKAEPFWDHSLFRDTIRKERWLQAYNGRIYSILSPHNDKLDLMKPLTEAEQYIISKLEIDFEGMRDRLMKDKLKFVIAIDEKNQRAYSGLSNMEFETKLTQLDSSKMVKRKTIAKHLNKNTYYGGYKWIKSATRIYNDQPTINIASLPDLA